MEYLQDEKTIVDYAYDVIKMHKELLRLRKENKYLKEQLQKYEKSFNEELRTNKAIMGNLLHKLLNKGETV